MSSNTDLILHCGGKEVEYDEVKSVQTPPSTDTWYPLPHHELFEAFSEGLKSGFDVSNVVHALNGSTGGDYFGLCELRPKSLANSQAAEDHVTVLGIRNSHLQHYAAGAVMGNSVFVCDNLSFTGEVRINRKHTRFIMRDMERLVHRMVEQLVDKREGMEKRIEAYKDARLPDLIARSLILRGVESRIIPANKVLDVTKEWYEPSHDEFKDRTAWSLFNAYTEVLKPYQLDGKTKRTQNLYGMMDSHIGLGV